MEIKQIKEETLKREFTVTMTAEEVAKMIDEKLTEIGKTVKMPGFRAGKVPMDLLKSKYGKAVMGEVLEKAVNDSTSQAIKDNDLRPAMRPQIEVKTFDEKKGLEYNMSIELLPEITVTDLEAIELKKLTSKPEKKAITEALENIAKGNKSSKKITEDRAAKKGDIVLIDFDGKVDGEPRPGMKGDDFELELGTKSFVDTFEDQLVGTKAGDKKKVIVTFPEDYASKELQGVEAVFDVAVKELRKPVVPKIDDEFAKKLGFDDLAKVEEAVAEQMQNEYDQVSRMTLKRTLLDVLDEKHDIPMPEGMVSAEFDAIWHQVKGHAHHSDDPDHVHGPDCAAEHGTEEERAEYRVIAERRVKLGLVLAEIGQQNNIQVTNQEIQQAVINEARRYPGQEQQVFEYYQKNPQALESVKAPVYEEKVVDFILENVKLDIQEVGIDELTKAAEEEPEKKAKKAKPATKAKKKPAKKATKKKKE